MDIEQAKAISLAQILDKIGSKPTKQKPHEAWYSSPLRTERTPSFHVNISKNIWYDFGESAGGNNIDFVCAYLKSTNENHTVADALRWLRNMTGFIPVITPVKSVEHHAEPKLLLKDKKKIEHPVLLQYLKKRGISLNVAQQYLEEVRLLNKETNKTFFALGLRNEEEGYEIRNPFFKGCVGAKSITFIRGAQPKPEGIHLYEGIMDYLSIITLRKGKSFTGDTIILNSLSMLGTATPYIQNYGYRTGYTWMDNDKSGQKASKSLADFFRTQSFLENMPMNKIYAPHKDVNAWHMYRLGLGE